MNAHKKAEFVASMVLHALSVLAFVALAAWVVGSDKTDTFQRLSVAFCGICWVWLVNVCGIIMCKASKPLAEFITNWSDGE